MKRFVRARAFLPEIAGLLGVGIVALTGAGAGATWLIVIGLLAIVIGINLGPERVELSRERRRSGRS